MCHIVGSATSVMSGATWYHTKIPQKHNNKKYRKKQMPPLTMHAQSLSPFSCDSPSAFCPVNNITVLNSIYAVHTIRWTARLKTAHPAWMDQHLPCGGSNWTHENTSSLTPPLTHAVKVKMADMRLKIAFKTGGRQISPFERQSELEMIKQSSSPRHSVL